MGDPWMAPPASDQPARLGMTPALLTSTSGAACGSLARYQIKPTLNSAGTPAHSFIAITEETQASVLRTGSCGPTLCDVRLVRARAPA